jgi:hypothetical protein
MWVFALWVFPIVGCTEVTGPTTAPFTLIVRSFDPQGTPILLQGAELCETDNTSNCETTDAVGRAVIQLPFDQEVSFTVTKEGYASDLIAVVIPPDGWSNQLLTLHLVQWAEDQHARVESPYPMEGTGTISMELPEGFAGATFELIEAKGKAFYWDEQSNWSLDLTETTSAGKGGFSEVTPGVFHVEFGGTAESCESLWGWPGDLEKSIRYPVREGYMTIAAASCPHPL